MTPDVPAAAPGARAALDAGWEVPAHAVTELAPRRRDHCVVIPVLNEGRRIARLLERMRALDIASIADVVVVDGGSRDGSVDPAVLRPLAVRALVVKTGPGKLGAQLRCGYAFALREGYAGIVTIDGNDKDDPEAIPRFVEELRGGCDFVQASRFVPGGVAERTPWLRWLAIRGVHAPALSLASGFRWTDTTQGFRGYSRRLLLDARVQPFRDVFSTYELLAYLSYAAPRLGFRCKELPTARRYPPGEVPTKISALRGNLALMRILAKTCLGAYGPIKAR